MRVHNALRWAAVVALLGLLAGPALAVALLGLTVVEVDGRSMEPAIMFGDVVVIKPPTPEDMVPGAIVTAENGDGAKYTHRIISVDEAGDVILRGDNNPVEDPAPVPPSAVVGVVAMHFDGAAATVVTQLQGWPLRICVLIMIVGLVFLPLAVWPSSKPRRRAEPAPVSHGRRRVGQAESPRLNVPMTARDHPRGSSAESLALVDQLQSAIAGVLLASDTRLTGRYTVRSTPQPGRFADLKMLVEISETLSTGDLHHGGAGDASRSARKVVPAALTSADYSAILWSRPSGSIPADLPTRRSRRVASAHGRRRAAGR